MLDALMNASQEHAGKLVFLMLVILIAVVVTRLSDKIISKALNRSSIPSVSIFINIVRVIIWSCALTTVLQPVFGINPTTFVTALGVSGVAISLGMQDTIANIVSGFGLMLGKVIQPGDMIRIQGTTGIVKDVTWRQTVIVERGGNRLVIPNAVLNTSSFERITSLAEACVQVPFVAKSTINPALVEKTIVERVQAATEALCIPGNPPAVRFTGFNAYGITGYVMVFANFDQFPSTVANAATRALMGADFMVQGAGVMGAEAESTSQK